MSLVCLIIVVRLFLAIHKARLSKQDNIEFYVKDVEIMNEILGCN